MGELSTRVSPFGRMKNGRCLIPGPASLLLVQGGREFFSFAHLGTAGLRLLLGLLLIFLFQPLTVPAQDTERPAVQDRLALLLEGDSEQKRSALAEIRNLRSEQASRLALAALSDKDEIVRATAASSVVFLPEAEAANALLPLLDDKRPFVRREAAYALGRVGHFNANARLIRSLTTDRDPEVRAASAVALGNIGNNSSLEPLMAILRKRPKEDDEFLRRSAARAVGQIFEQIAKGSTAVLTPQNFLPPEFKDGMAANNLTPMIGSDHLDKIASTLVSVIRSPNEADDTRREAAFALGAMRRPESAGLLRSLLGSPDPYLAEISKEALLKIEPQK